MITVRFFDSGGQVLRSGVVVAECTSHDALEAAVMLLSNGPLRRWSFARLTALRECLLGALDLRATSLEVES